MQTADRSSSRRQRPRVTGVSLLLAVLAWSLSPAAHAAAPRYSFAVLADALQSPADEAPVQRMIDTIGRDPRISFVVYDGNLKGADEACDDSLYDRRQTLLQTARPALIFVPGQHDWVDCSAPEAGGFDPLERLDRLRQTLFADASSMGQNPVGLTRESEVSRFRPYRENVRWETGDTVFIGLNVPGQNNHYLIAGGRNGEFEDRVIANAFWLNHAAEYAKRRGARAIVVFIQGDPDPERYERPDRFAWLRFARNPHRDGYLELKRSFVKLAETFRGPVLIIHGDDRRVPAGFVIDQPLRDDKGERVANLTRIAFAPPDRLTQWMQIDVEMNRRPPFRVSIRDVPQHPLPPSAPPSPLHEEPAAPSPETPALPPASGYVPSPQEPAHNDNGSAGVPPGPAGIPASPSGSASSVQRGF